MGLVAISRSTVVAGVVQQSPEVLLAQAQRVVPGITADEYSLARVIASEAGSRPEAEQLVIAACDSNRARSARLSLLAHIARGGKYGAQGTGGRLQSSRLDPTEQHARLAMRVVREKLDPTGGAEIYFNPAVQWRCHTHPRECSVVGELNRNQSPEAVVRSWSYIMERRSCGRDASERYVCVYGPPTGRRNQWVGPIRGIDPWRLMVFRRGADEATHEERTRAALEVIAAGIKGQSSVYGGGAAWPLVLAGGSVVVAAWIATRK